MQDLLTLQKQLPEAFYKKGAKNFARVSFGVSFELDITNKMNWYILR